MKADKTDFTAIAMQLRYIQMDLQGVVKGGDLLQV